MSYGIFLHTKTTHGSGKPKPLPPAAIKRLITLSTSAGFQRSLPERGLEEGTRFSADTPSLLAELVLLDFEAAFFIPGRDYPPLAERAKASIALCQRIAQQVASEHDLLVIDDS